MTLSSRPIERGAPRVQRTGPLVWTQKHLFNSPFNSVITIVLGGVIIYALYSMLTWAFIQAPWAVVTENFAQYMVGLYPPEFYWRVWTIFALVLALAGVSWGILARNQKQLFSPPVLIGFGIAVLLLILLPMTRPYLVYSLGSLALLAVGAIAGQQVGRNFSKAPQFISAGWFISYFVVLYLLGGNAFTQSLLYAVLFQIGLGLLVGWQLASRLAMPILTQWLGRLALLAAGFCLGYYVLGNIFFPVLGAVLSYPVFLWVMRIVGILLGVALIWVFSDSQTLENIGRIALFLIGFAGVFVLMGWLPAMLGLEFGLETVRTNSWGGLTLTLFLAISGIALCFPAGVLLALGRRSKLPLIRMFSVTYIELVRGVPLISILFMGQVLIPLFLPEGMRPDPVVRAIIGLTIFSAAYLAENVRAGLQSVPQGQGEAAQSLGLNKPLTMALIVLPQALKTAIPAIVGQFISLFQDTTLLGIVGLLELLGITRNLLANPNYLGDFAPAYVFIGVIYWVFCYGMSYGSRRVEAALNTDLR
ncbi:ABC transporter, permease protein [Synechococcus sp. PCC 7335]|uniref:amino acid ABC transporter permease n=1 Tax=Synechococcus sp. (strain ATCC 29403 / PCC 7335) TaxID=91464 RepID=UPI00017EC062|nr:amino acid ABC transporter permease [Synechococcus sp. PCC 7335]EDX84697.1 ABC transporter, permease protein [Synechococcus sp. PCC 7335]